MTLYRFAFAVTLAGALVATSAFGQNGTTRSRRAEAPPPARAQQPPAGSQKVDPMKEVPIDNDTVVLEADVVNVLFTVTDPQNRFVPDIAEADVVISESGVQQKVFSFAKQTNLPLAVAVLVDVSSSQEYTFGDEKRAAQAFLQGVLRPRKDTAAIVKFREDTSWVQGMTNRLERVYEAFNRLEWESRTTAGSRFGATAFYDAVGVTATELFPKPDADPTPETMVRRAIVVLTDGDDNASDRTLQEAIDDAIRSDVIVYAVGIGDRYRSTAVKKDVLETLARQTGGRAYFPESYTDLRAAFKQIDEELRSQYVLAYVPTNTSHDGAFREIAVTVPGRQDIRVYHRKGYYAPKPKVGP
jgi:VWFA-related protein